MTDNNQPIKHDTTQPSVALGLEQNPLLDDIELKIRIEIGQTKIKISELLALQPGGILELDEDANAPVSIYANDKFIGKGQIVSTNGAYSIRML